ncbi:hypothetical protein QQ045_009524 [Rhodiola kirilowii]
MKGIGRKQKNAEKEVIEEASFCSSFFPTFDFEDHIAVKHLSVKRHLQLRDIIFARTSKRYEKAAEYMEPNTFFVEEVKKKQVEKLCTKNLDVESTNVKAQYRRTRAYLGNWDVIEFETPFLISAMGLDEDAYLVHFANNIFMFSVPRPPEEVDLDHEITLEAKEVKAMPFRQAYVANNVLHLINKCNQAILKSV